MMDWNIRRTGRVYFFSFKTLKEQIIADLVVQEIIKTKCKFWWKKLSRKKNSNVFTKVYTLIRQGVKKNVNKLWRKIFFAKRSFEFNLKKKWRRMHVSFSHEEFRPNLPSLAIYALIVGTFWNFLHELHA